MELSDRVRFRREQLKMTQDELALKMGYKSRTSINKIEMGRPVSQKIVTRLAEALDTNIAYLMGWEENEKPAQSSGELSEIDAIFNELSPSRQAKLLELARLYLDGQRRNEETE